MWSNVFMVAGLQPGERLLVHGGAGGIGTMAIQLADRAAAPRSSPPPARRRSSPLCRELGADVTINYREQDFVEVLEATDGAAPTSSSTTWARSTSAATSTRSPPRAGWSIIGMQGGTKGELDISALLRKRGAVIATSLRARPVEEKAAICAAVVEHVWPLVADGRGPPDRARRRCRSRRSPRAHALMEAGDHIGKIAAHRSERVRDAVGWRA